MLSHEEIMDYMGGMLNGAFALSGAPPIGGHYVELALPEVIISPYSFQMSFVMMNIIGTLYIENESMIG